MVTEGTLFITGVITSDMAAKYEYTIDESMMTSCTKVVCGLILDELVALKHIRKM